MNISEIPANQGKIDVEGVIAEKSEPREFSKFGSAGKVCSAVLKDDSGQVTLTLWNEQVEDFNVGDKVKLTNGYAKEWQGDKQLSTGKFGKLEKL